MLSYLSKSRIARHSSRIRHTENRCKYVFVLAAISSVKVETLTMLLYALGEGEMLGLLVKCKLLCAQAVRVRVHIHEYPSHWRVMHMDTTVKLLPGTQRFWKKKIHLGRIDEPRSAKAYDFGNSLAVFQNFFGQSTSLIACKTHGNLSIYHSLELWTLETLRSARLIRINGRTRGRNYGH